MKPEIPLAILISIFLFSVFSMYCLFKKGMKDAKNNINNIEVTYTEVKNK